jgi:hypothetical protein
VLGQQARLVRRVRAVDEVAAHGGRGRGKPLEVVGIDGCTPVRDRREAGPVLDEDDGDAVALQMDDAVFERR